MRLKALAVAAALLTLVPFVGTEVATANPLSGAIFTTLPDGSEVNFNHYASKDLVYLDGGPGVGAPATAAGLPDGTYVFQVTNPNGRVLLSTDNAECRQFTVSGGVITGVVATGCEHLTGVDVDHNAVTVQLMPYDDTPNPGGVYKAWATPLADFLAGCAALGVADGLSVVDCGRKPGNMHGFIPANSKTDNFKVKEQTPQEIDTRFFSASGDLIDGLSVTWTDPLGGSNKKWSYYAPGLSVYHEAHVEAVEAGTHQIQVGNQPGCTVGAIKVAGKKAGNGPQTLSVKVGSTSQAFTIFVDVQCA